MAEAHTHRSVRFDRRQAMIPVSQKAPDSQSLLAEQHHMGAVALLLAGVVVLFAGALAYGYVLYSDQTKELAALRVKVSDQQAANVGGYASDPTSRALQTERDQIAAALALARQRIAALQAELGATATGQSGLTEPLETSADHDLNSLILEVRLLRRERDAARDQMDRLIRSRDALKADLVRAEAELAQIAAAVPATTGPISADPIPGGGDKP